jgi:hypothetical protein
MKYFTVRTIFIFLLVVSCLTVAIARIATRDLSQQKLGSQEYVIPLVVVDGKKGFVPTGAACGNGFTLLYKSLDGVDVLHSGGRYTAKVKRAVQALLKDAIVIERGPKLDNAGQVVGERVVVVYQKKDNGRQASTIYWTTGDGIECISGDSLEHILSFEQLRRVGW